MLSNYDWMLLKECSECGSLCTKWKNTLSHLVLRNKNKEILLHTNFSGELTRHTVVRNLQDPTEDPLLSLDLSSEESLFLVKYTLSLFSCKGQDKGELDAQHFLFPGVNEAWITTITVNCAEGLYLKGLVELSLSRSSCVSLRIKGQ